MITLNSRINLISISESQDSTMPTQIVKDYYFIHHLYSLHVHQFIIVQYFLLPHTNHAIHSITGLTQIINSYP